MASHFLEQQQQQQKRLSRVVTQECHKICVPFLTSGLMLLQILRAQTIATTTTTKDREKKTNNTRLHCYHFLVTLNVTKPQQFLPTESTVLCMAAKGDFSGFS